MKSIKYRSGYKYQLAENYSTMISIRPAQDIATGFILLNTAGLLIIKQGYAWDGPSGPTADTPDTMRGSLVHDALYQLLRLGLLSADKRLECDHIAYKIWVEDGMPKLQARVWRWCLNSFAGFAANGKDVVLTAP